MKTTGQHCTRWQIQMSSMWKVIQIPWQSQITWTACTRYYNEWTAYWLKSKTKKDQNQDELNDYLICLFRLAALHKSLDSVVDMTDGHRCARSAKYETAIFKKTTKVKYLIGSVHLTAMCVSLPFCLRESLIVNRCISISGGKKE